MGLLQQSDWKGDWIGYDEARAISGSDAPLDDAKWIWFVGDKAPNFPKAQRVFMSAIFVPKNRKSKKPNSTFLPTTRVPSTSMAS